MIRFKINREIKFLFHTLLLFTYPVAADTNQRIISVNGTVTEIIYALNLESQLVAVDSTSYYPKQATTLPNVGYQRTLTTEGILNFKPSQVIGLESAGPAATIQNLKDAGIPLRLFADDFKIETPTYRVLEIGKLLGKEKEARILAKTINEQIKKLNIKKSNIKVLFIYSRNPSSVFISGTGTAAHAMIELSGAKNAVNEFSEYKPLTSEALVKANPDIILMPEKSALGFGGEKAIWEINGMEFTRAGKEKNLILVDDLLLLGFGPRLPLALKTLNDKWKQIE
ncbi:ABC transporter substrate-binding protein [Leptospira sp. 2 VSF19]|uniref:ABC transporter substrate-binding protein n=1 Tax=Leptospira soteropolitanensis TaxID=2950025 RepID=A0AAW5VG09_9LEPT|nr:ABC transporter substrate-binding protein [Leptospira soteropolitanensis]MCW7492507.1 ABC transporter substrate-binding protein [Leptospira soteropolitanensis]MCW7500556.1 ABC transporter substrate-binding protein [Leptospira soteropolitanensis]MCW7522774.1 ABC transporter substrate-binding protein [Leptospira soteropolitanensis]MCW7526631.1 ABC transporter substrate-binding protein [Leptospira soteropolitanensis]MCW7530526.1 ABC transporter substrate-binding protein [Leptospira soteropolit